MFKSTRNVYSLNQRIKKLSSTKFGSQESGLNRQGVAAPTTNKHAIEGSNPVYNNEVDPKDIDRTRFVFASTPKIVFFTDCFAASRAAIQI